MNKKIFSLFLLIIFAELLYSPAVYALPDLTLQSSDISFSNANPETNQNITITLQISNTGDAYGTQVFSVPFSSYTQYTSSETYGVYQTRWFAQYFVADDNYELGRATLLIANLGDTTDEAFLQIRNDGTVEAGKLKPGADSNSIIATSSATCTSSTLVWQDFDFETPLELTQGVTYWLCLGSTSTYTNHYLWGFSHFTPYDGIAMTFNQGNAWYDVTNVKALLPDGTTSYNLTGFYRIYKTTSVPVSIFDGDPLSGGILIHSAEIQAHIGSNSSENLSFSWTPSSEGTHNIYVVIDESGDINESNELNNIVYRTINVSNNYPAVSSVAPADGTAGLSLSATPSVLFTEAMDAATLSNNITLTAVRNNRGETLSTPVSGTVAYTAASLTATFIPDTALSHNYTYRLTVTTEATDTYGNAIQESVSADFSTILDAAEENVVADADGTTELTIPADAVPFETYYIRIIDNPSETDAIRNANNKVNTLHIPFQYRVPDVSKAFEVYKNAYPGELQDQVTFSEPLRLSMPYTDNGDGTVTSYSRSVPEESLALYCLNETDHLWVKLPTSQIDTVNNRVTAAVSHLSYFTVIAEHGSSLSSAYAYPVPFKPNSDPTHTAIKFVGLTPQATIKIYTITGELVKEIHETDGDGFNDTWDARETASGMYIYRIENENESKTGQLLIIK